MNLVEATIAALRAPIEFYSSLSMIYSVRPALSQRAVAGDQTVFVAVPLSVDGDRIIELAQRDFGHFSNSTSAIKLSNALVIAIFSSDRGLLAAGARIDATVLLPCFLLGHWSRQHRRLSRLDSSKQRRVTLRARPSQYYG